MKIGAHVSAAGGIFNAPANAAKIGCEVLQIFSRSPQGGPAPKLTSEIVSKYKAEMKYYNLSQAVIHTPYYINFASMQPRIRYGSIAIVREELERGSMIGAEYVVTHLGSTKDAGKTIGFQKTWRAIQRILDGYKGSCTMLMEMSAGAGDLVGGSFEELAALLKSIESVSKYKNKVQICLDTCHAFAAGYDLRNKKSVDVTFKQFDKLIGLRRLKLFHANDSKFGLSEHRDRHEHIGKGNIGLEGFKAIVRHPKLRNINMILETPWDTVLKKDIELLKKFRTT